LGCLNHHDTHKFFPTGGWGWNWVGDPDRGYGKDQPGGWNYNVLTYIEEGALHDKGADGDPVAVPRPQREGARDVVLSPLPIINCPSRRQSRVFPMGSNQANSGLKNSLTPDEAGRGDYAANAGHALVEFGADGGGPDGGGMSPYENVDAWFSQRPYPGRVNGSATGEDLLTGVSFFRSEIGIRRVSDGTSKTYLVGERYIPFDLYETGSWPADNETWCTGFNNDNYRKTARGANGTVEATPVQDTQIDPSTNNELDYRGRFGSAHSGSLNMAMCDGSVQSVSYDIDWQIHRDLGNRQDGNIADVNGR
jgi:prepilin-type processing-associated H-X9-DG protein